MRREGLLKHNLVHACETASRLTENEELRAQLQEAALVLMAVDTGSLSARRDGLFVLVKWPLVKTEAEI